jgi:type VI protein secretion system component Hcp
MIVARFCDQSKGKIVSGSSTIERYNGKDHGWFPIESFNFGFDDKGDSSAGGAAGHGAPAKAPAAASKPAGGAAPGKGGKKEFSQLSMEKQVDTVTCLLMELAMSEVGTKKGTDSKQQTKLEVDIHILSSVQLEQKVERFVFTNLMIHLEAVNIVSWQIRGSGDSRPTESVTLRYDRAAMIYVRTPDAKAFDPLIGPKGWDQTNSKTFTDGDFNWSSSKWEEFLPKRG